MSIKLLIEMSIVMSIKMSVKNVSQNVSREPSFRYTTILQKKTIRKCDILDPNHKEMRYNERKLKCREPNFRYTTRPNHKQTYTKHPHIPQNRKIPENWVSRGPGGIFAKNACWASKIALFFVVFAMQFMCFFVFFRSI